MATLRAFIALELPETAKEALAATQMEMQNAARRRRLPVGQALRWVAPEGIHLTLKFLGNVDSDAVADLERAVAAAADGLAAPRLGLGPLGAFPDPRQPRVLWVGLTGDLETVARLQQRLEGNLAQLGFAPERRRFSPHLTLARVREQIGPDERKAVADLVAGGTSVSAFAFRADQLSLMKSELRPTGARYEALFTVHLR